MGFWDEFEHDPRSADNAHLRASDRDRDVVHALLGTAYSDGRLDRDEFDDRAARVTAARTLAELPPIVADLVSTSTRTLMRPSELRAEAERRYARERREAAFSFLVPSLVCWVIWVSVLVGGHGTWFPWPIFPTVVTGGNLLRMLTDKEGQVASIQRRLEKRQTRALERGAQVDPPGTPLS